MSRRFTRRTRLLLGAATAWPFVYLAGFFLFGLLMALFMTGTAATMAQGGSGEGPTAAFFGLFGAVGIVMVLHFLTILEIFALMGFYVWHVVQNDELSSNERTFWALLVFFLNLLAMPFYWWKVIWNAPPVEGEGAA